MYKRVPRRYRGCDTPTEWDEAAAAVVDRGFGIEFDEEAAADPRANWTPSTRSQRVVQGAF